MKPKTLIGVGMSKPTWHLGHDHVNNVARTCAPMARHLGSLTELPHVISVFDRNDKGKCGFSCGD
jgi:hypothetical protein